MCTVTFLPAGDTVYITSNRDESPHRQSQHLTSVHTPEGQKVFFPLDPDSGGSWIALSATGRAVCLLNGAFEPFRHEPPYRQSRGQVVVDAGLDPELNNFLLSYSFQGIAPFTLLVFEKGNFHQLVWDGNEKFLTQLDPQEKNIWSSVTLYPPDVRKRRIDLFNDWTKVNPEFSRDDIISFHQYTEDDPLNDFIMNRNEIVKTLSVTSIMINKDSSSLWHLKLDPPSRDEIHITHE